MFSTGGLRVVNFFLLYLLYLCAWQTNSTKSACTQSLADADEEANLEVSSTWMNHICFAKEEGLLDLPTLLTVLHLIKLFSPPRGNVTAAGHLVWVGLNAIQ